MAQPTYLIHNLCRSVHTRALRAASLAERAPKKLILGGGKVRVVRGRPAPVTEAALKSMLQELVSREKRGHLKVTTPDGRRVDLQTLAVVEELPPPEPKPNKPLDSAARDNKYPIGEPKPQFFGGKALTEELETPAVLAPDIPEGREEEEPIPPTLGPEEVAPPAPPSMEEIASEDVSPTEPHPEAAKSSRGKKRKN